MDVWDALPVAASLLVIAAAFFSPQWTAKQRFTFAALWAIVSVVIFFNGSAWGHFNGVACLAAAGIVAMSAQRLKKAKPPVG